ncbi:preprotein translocase subunit SecY ['Fragaria x ananassa' phyllody phytoplasma]|uniref:Protein translocase subunit SecY n=1 Tax='Fragaria x ananassa' phyllody phytoplasma TaxID=2358428 RepID=A0ABS5K4T7_9MOLU|nr:preprotein translocase subunit SecY ['Fragaria x ananassa' phyllody phytoplasma]MBS2126320.1 preprotein translocase subunit SecY ['Fragaria x ananassa' phyllody phytoplasma]
MKGKLKLILGNPKLIFQILFTLFILFLFKVGCDIDLPLIPKQIELLSLPGMPFSKTKLWKLFGLGIYPYITASIVVQFLQKLLPLCREWKEQGQMGKRKLNLLTRVLAMLFVFGQTFSYLNEYNHSWFVLQSVSILHCFLIALMAAAGCALLIWFADLINSKGIGNGTSILIMASMSGNLIDSLKEIYQKYLVDYNNEKLLIFVGVLSILFVFLILTVVVQTTFLKIPVHYARNQTHTRGKSYIPFKINTAGVMPLILASALLQPFQFLAQVIRNESFKYLVKYFTTPNIINFAFALQIVLIVVFSFFSTFMNVNPEDISEHLSKQDAYLAGLRPGEQTTNYLSSLLFKITVLGTIFFVSLVTMPYLMDKFLGLKQMKLGGTSLLIIVSVAIETIQRIMATANKKEYAKLL